MTRAEDVSRFAWSGRKTSVAPAPCCVATRFRLALRSGLSLFSRMRQCRYATTISVHIVCYLCTPHASSTSQVFQYYGADLLRSTACSTTQLKTLSERGPKSACDWSATPHVRLKVKHTPFRGKRFPCFEHRTHGQPSTGTSGSLPSCHATL